MNQQRPAPDGPPSVPHRKSPIQRKRRKMAPYNYGWRQNYKPRNAYDLKGAEHLLSSELPQGFNEELAFRALAAYALLRTLSRELRLSPFTPNVFLRGLNLPVPSPVMGQVHVALLRALLPSLGYTFRQRGGMSTTKKRRIDGLKCSLRGGDNLLYLDTLTWPLFYDDYAHLSADVLYERINDISSHVDFRTLGLPVAEDVEPRMLQEEEDVEEEVAYSRPAARGRGLPTRGRGRGGRGIPLKQRKPMPKPNSKTPVARTKKRKFAAPSDSESEESYNVEEEEEEESDEEFNIPNTKSRRKRGKKKVPPPKRPVPPRQLRGSTAPAIPASSRPPNIAGPITAPHLVPHAQHVWQQRNPYNNPSQLPAGMYYPQMVAHAAAMQRGMMRPGMMPSLSSMPRPKKMSSPRLVAPIPIPNAHSQPVGTTPTTTTATKKNDKHSKPDGTTPTATENIDKPPPPVQQEQEMPVQQEPKIVLKNFPPVPRIPKPSTTGIIVSDEVANILETLRSPKPRAATNQTITPKEINLENNDKAKNAVKSENGLKSGEAETDAPVKVQTQEAAIDTIQEGPASIDASRQTSDTLILPAKQAEAAEEQLDVKSTAAPLPQEATCDKDVIIGEATDTIQTATAPIKTATEHASDAAYGVPSVNQEAPAIGTSKVDATSTRTPLLQQTISDVPDKATEADEGRSTGDAIESSPSSMDVVQQTAESEAVQSTSKVHATTGSGLSPVPQTTNSDAPADLMESNSEMDTIISGPTSMADAQPSDTTSHLPASKAHGSSPARPVPQANTCDSRAEAMKEEEVKSSMALDIEMIEPTVSGVTAHMLKQESDAISAKVDNAVPTVEAVLVPSASTQPEQHMSSGKMDTHRLMSGSSTDHDSKIKQEVASAMDAILEKVADNDRSMRSGTTAQSPSLKDESSTEIPMMESTKSKSKDDASLTNGETFVKDKIIEETKIAEDKGTDQWPQFKAIELMRDGTPYHRLPLERKIEILEFLIDELLNLDFIAAEFTRREAILSCYIDQFGKSPTAEELAAMENGDECAVCGLEGDLLCCDGCPSSYHKNCVGMRPFESLPEGEWLCPECAIVDPASFGNLRGDRKAGVEWFTLERLKAAASARHVQTFQQDAEGYPTVLDTAQNLQVGQPGPDFSSIAGGAYADEKRLMVHGFMFQRTEHALPNTFAKRDDWKVILQPYPVLSKDDVFDFCHQVGNRDLALWPLSQLPHTPQCTAGTAASIVSNPKCKSVPRYFHPEATYDPTAYVSKYSQAPLPKALKAGWAGKPGVLESMIESESIHIDYRMLHAEVGMDMSMDACLVQSLRSHGLLCDPYTTITSYMKKLHSSLSKAGVLEESWGLKNRKFRTDVWVRNVDRCRSLKKLGKLLVAIVDAIHPLPFLPEWFVSPHCRSGKLNAAEAVGDDKKSEILPTDWSADNEKKKRKWEQCTGSNVLSLLAAEGRNLSEFIDGAKMRDKLVGRKRKVVETGIVPQETTLSDNGESNEWTWKSTVDSMETNSTDDTAPSTRRARRQTRSGDAPQSRFDISNGIARLRAAKIKELEKLLSVPSEREIHWPICGRYFFDPVGYLKPKDMKRLGRKAGCVAAPYLTYSNNFEVGQGAFCHIWRKRVLDCDGFEEFAFLLRLLRSFLDNSVMTSCENASRRYSSDPHSLQKRIACSRHDLATGELEYFVVHQGRNRGYWISATQVSPAAFATEKAVRMEPRLAKWTKQKAAFEEAIAAEQQKAREKAAAALRQAEEKRAKLKEAELARKAASVLGGVAQPGADTLERLLLQIRTKMDTIICRHTDETVKLLRQKSKSFSQQILVIRTQHMNQLIKYNAQLIAFKGKGMDNSQLSAFLGASEVAAKGMYSKEVARRKKSAPSLPDSQSQSSGFSHGHATAARQTSPTLFKSPAGHETGMPQHYSQNQQHQTYERLQQQTLENHRRLQRARLDADAKQQQRLLEKQARQQAEVERRRQQELERLRQQQKKEQERQLQQRLQQQQLLQQQEQERQLQQRLQQHQLLLQQQQLQQLQYQRYPGAQSALADLYAPSVFSPTPLPRQAQFFTQGGQYQYPQHHDSLHQQHQPLPFARQHVQQHQQHQHQQQQQQPPEDPLMAIFDLEPRPLEDMSPQKNHRHYGR